jgi:hypothetical protein
LYSSFFCQILTNLYRSALIGFFKPRPPPSNADVGNPNGDPKAVGANGTNTNVAPEQASPKTLVNGKKPKPTLAQLGHEIGFDLILTRCSLLIDIISHSLVAILPAPINTADVQMKLRALGTPGDDSFNRSQAMFIVSSSLNGMGSGAVPAIHSLALCMIQVRALNARTIGADGQPSGAEEAHEEEGTGALFGALAVLQAVGQMILGVCFLPICNAEIIGPDFFPVAFALWCDLQWHGSDLPEGDLRGSCRADGVCIVDDDVCTEPCAYAFFAKHEGQ